MTRFLSRDLPQHKHTVRNLANLLARNCILSPPLARHPLTTCACVLCVRLGHFCNPLAFPPSRALSLSLSFFLSLCFILLSFRESFCVFSYFIFPPPSPLFLQQPKRELYTVRNVAAVKISRTNTSLPTTTTICYSQRGQRTTPHAWGRFC